MSSNYGGGHSHSGGGDGSHSHGDGGSGGGEGYIILGTLGFILVLISMEFTGMFIYARFHHNSTPNTHQGIWEFFYCCLGAAVVAFGIGLLAIITGGLTKKSARSWIATFLVCGAIAAVAAFVLRTYVIAHKPSAPTELTEPPSVSYQLRNVTCGEQVQRPLVIHATVANQSCVSNLSLASDPPGAQYSYILHVKILYEGTVPAKVSICGPNFYQNLNGPGNMPDLGNEACVTTPELPPHSTYTQAVALTTGMPTLSYLGRADLGGIDSITEGSGPVIDMSPTASFCNTPVEQWPCY